MDYKLAELIGIIMGDGFIHKHKNSYRIGVVGHPINDKEYFQTIKKLILEVWQKDVKIVERARGLRITFGSKKVFNQLVNDFKLPYGAGKCAKVVIPSSIYSDWNLAKHTIRGLVDTDESIFTANKPGSPNYPSIEITTTSYFLALQIKQILTEQNFRVAKIWAYRSKISTMPSYKVALNGWISVSKWLKEIGFSNPYKLKRAQESFKRKHGTAGIFILTHQA